MKDWKKHFENKKYSIKRKQAQRVPSTRIKIEEKKNEKRNNE